MSPVERHVRLALTACVVCVAVLAASPAQGASLEQVRALAQQARYPEARAAFEGLPSELRAGFDARLLDGVLRVREGSLDEAIEVFGDIVRTHPDRPEPRINLALLDAARWGVPDVREPLVDAAPEDRAGATGWWLLRDLYIRLALQAYLHADTIAPGGPAEEATAGLPPRALLRMPFEPDARSEVHPLPSNELRSDPAVDDDGPALPIGASEAPNPNAAGAEKVALAARSGVPPVADAAGSADAIASVPQFGSGDVRREPDGAHPNAAAARATGAYLEAVADGLTTVASGNGGGRHPEATPATDAASVASSSHASSWNALLKAFAVAAGTMVVLATIGGIVLHLRGRPPRDRAFRRRLQRAAALLGGPSATVEKESEESIFRPADRRSRFSGLRDRIEARYPLLRIGKALPVATGAGVAGAVGCWFSMAVLQVPVAWWTMPATVLAGVGAFWYAISWLQSRQEAEFIRQFPELVDQIVRLAGAGVPPLEAVAVVAEDARDPIAPVLGSVRDGLLAGLDADTTLRIAAERVRLGEFTLFAAVIRLQRRAGGGISAAFSNLADTLRERRATALKAHASTAQSRLTLLVLVLMPVVVLIAQKFIAPQSVDMLFGTEQGVTILRWGVGLVVTGILVARNIAARAVR